MLKFFCLNVVQHTIEIILQWDALCRDRLHSGMHTTEIISAV